MQTLHLLDLYLLALSLILVATTFTFSLALRKRNNSIMDIAYGLIFPLVSILLSYLYLLQNKMPLASKIILILIMMWGFRLSYRIYNRNKGKLEDFRYASWRAAWQAKGKVYFFVRSYFQIFVLQGIVISLVLLPFITSLQATKISLLSLLGILVWILGFFFEAVGDAELDAFLAKKHQDERFLMTGLFAYTRHPNYFGESMMWLGLALIAFGGGGSLLAFLSPILITCLLLFVSGIPLVEARWKNDPVWQEYAKKTSAFFPLPPRKS